MRAAPRAQADHARATYSGKAPRYRYTRGLARNLLKTWSALWAFLDHAGVEPTNNHTERGLRGAVIYRKLSLGSHPTAASAASSACCRFTPPAHLHGTARLTHQGAERLPRSRARVDAQRVAARRCLDIWSMGRGIDSRLKRPASDGALMDHVDEFTDLGSAREPNLGGDACPLAPES